MWKKDNPTASRMEVHTRDTAGLSGVRPTPPASSIPAEAERTQCAVSPLGVALGKATPPGTTAPWRAPVPPGPAGPA